jgi:hypothetical protein
MHYFIFYTGQSYITLFEEICFQYFLPLYFYNLQHYPETHVKFISINKQRSVDVFLNNVGDRFGIITIHFDTYLKWSLT